MLRLDLKDGTVYGFTDHDKNLDFDLSDTAGSITYRADLGMLVSDISMACGLDAGNCEITAPIGSVITLDGVLGGRFNYAEARVFEVNWKELTAGALKFMRGNTTEWRVEGGKAVAEIRDLRDKFNQTVGRVITNQCDADFADGIRCFATATTVVGTVTAVTDAMRFTVSYSGSYADDFYNKGTVEALTGNLAGTAPIEIEDWTVGGAITLFTPLVEAPAIGDTFTVRNGCGKSRADCMAHNAIEWFRGYPEVPGRKALMPAVPGA